MPRDLWSGEDSTDSDLQHWTDSIITVLQQGRSVIMAVSQTPVASSVPAQVIADRMASAVRRIVPAGSVHELCIEGGATASALVRRLGWQQFVAVESLAPGVVRMAVKDQDAMYLTTKPGSYAWPSELQDAWQKTILGEVNQSER